MDRYIKESEIQEVIDKWQESLSPRTDLRDSVIFDTLESVNFHIDDLATADVAEVAQSLWKKTANEKPDSTRHLIVANGSLISHYGYYLKPKDKWYKTYECEEEIEVPTYWMDMPTPPKESIYGECAVMDGKKVE